MNSYHRFNSQPSRQSGYSLFEVLIAVVVTSIGLLGLAGIQATGLKNNMSAYQRSQATVLAYDISDRMRANASYIDDARIKHFPINKYLSSEMTLDEAVAAGAVAGCKTTDGCTPEQMAQTDLVEWHLALTTALPGATGIITVDDRGTESIEDDIFMININWDDVDADNDPDFQMSFQPLILQPSSLPILGYEP